MTKLQQKLWKLKHPEKIKEYQRKAKIKYKQDMTEWKSLALEEQEILLFEYAKNYLKALKKKK